jgi:hypothetical protein
MEAGIMAARKQRTRRIRQRGSYSSSGSTSGVTGRIFDALLVLSGELAQERMVAGAGKIQELAEATRDFARSMPDIPEARAYVAFAARNLEALANSGGCGCFRKAPSGGGHVRRRRCGLGGHSASENKCQRLCLAPPHSSS